MPGLSDAASARPPSTSSDALAGARVALVSGSFKIDRRHCSPVLPHDGGYCDDAVLKTRITSHVVKATTPLPGSPKFPERLALAILTSGYCETGSESVPAPDGTTQQLLGSARATLVKSDTTQVLIGTGKAGARWAWLEPLSPSTPCYGLALPRRGPDAVPRDLVSPWIVPAELKRRQFKASVVGSRHWTSENPDGTTNFWDAIWSFEITYVRDGRATNTSS